MPKTDDLAIRADRLFDAALDLSAAERSALLERQCAGEPELKQLVERLLSHVETDDDLPTGGGLAGPLWDDLRDNLSDESGPVGTVIERYRVLREIGRGGMAVVYLAERADRQFDQQVALKLIKRGTDTDEVVRRFRQERQIMALARHPNIARLLDGGTTADGRPYFVMEHVDGQPIDRYCDRQRLTVRQRLELFLDVARAVAYAHRNLVVHRDIKPSNILVTEAGEVKLLDFGIAKLLRRSLDFQDGVALTRSQMRFLTPAYASPEQVHGAPVTTASDIYQLGLLLYLLITGRSPYRRGSSSSSRELAQAITEEPPRRPSAAVGLAETPAAASERTTAQAICFKRRTTSARLRRELAGDLDNIVLMTLRKEPERRYASTAQLIDDVERYLAGRPVSARRGSPLYRTGKFLRRHRVASTVAAAALALVVGLVAFYTARLTAERNRANRSAEQASREAEAARRVSDFLTGLFEVSDPGESRGNAITAREILDRGAERIGEELDGEPLMQARLMRTMGIVYRSLGLYQPATRLLERTVELRREHLPQDHADTAVGMAELAILYRQLGRYGDAETLYRRALPILEASEEPDAPLAEITNNLAELYRSQGRLAEAETLYKRSLELFEQQGAGDGTIAGVLNNLALLYRTAERPADAEPLYRRALPLLEQTLGDDHPHVAVAANNLALVYRDQQKYTEAEPLYRRALAILERVVGPEHPQVAVALHNLADLHADRGELDDAEPLYRRSQAILEAALGPEHPNVATSLDSQADLFAARGDLERAEALFQRVLSLREAALGAEHPQVAHTQAAYAELLRRTGRDQQAADFEARAAAIRAKYGR